MVHSFFLIRIGERVLGGIYRRFADECAGFLGIELCYDHKCEERREGLPHAHVPETMEGLKEFGEVRWDADVPRVLRFELSRLGI